MEEQLNDVPLSVFDMLPKREDGTTITPWDKEWATVTNIGNVHRKDDNHLILYEPRWSNIPDVKERVWNFRPPEQTGEKVPWGVLAMLAKGHFKAHFDKLYAEIDEKYGLKRTRDEHDGRTDEGSDERED